MGFLDGLLGGPKRDTLPSGVTVRHFRTAYKYRLLAHFDAAFPGRETLLWDDETTGIELAVGAVFNLGLGWRIWDYSGQPLNFKGQICLLYSGLWYLLSLPIAWISAYLYRIWF